MIKYLIAFLAASFLFACAAEARTGKSKLPGNNTHSLAVINPVA
jgi:hypothetical protein